jgi:hypothetical protein
VVQRQFTLQEQICAVSSLFKRHENIPASLADSVVIQLTEINDSPLRFSTDSDFPIYRRHGRQPSPLISP